MNDIDIKKILLVNGPNLGRLGVRKTEVYGKFSLKSLVSELKSQSVSAEIIDFQSNHEGEIIDFIEKHHESKGIIINPGALMMSGWSLRDCLEDFSGKKIEVHISNIWAREEFRHESIISPVVDGVVSGLGMRSYILALDYIESYFNLLIKR